METYSGANGAGTFVPKYSGLAGKASEIFGEPGAFYKYMESEAPGMFFDESYVPHGGRKTIIWPWNRQRQLFNIMKDPHLMEQGKKIDDLGSQVYANFRKRFPDAADPLLNIINSPNVLKTRGQYDALRNIADVDLHPVALSQALAQSSVRSKHPIATKLIADAAKGVNRASKWVIPGAMLAGTALRDEIPGSADNAVFNAVTKYGPEAFLGTSLAANALPALEFKRTLDFLPDSMRNKQFLKAQAGKNALKVLAGYGLLKGLSHLTREKPIEKEGSSRNMADIMKAYMHDYGGKYVITPAMIGAALMGLKGVAENADEGKIPATAAPLFATMRQPAAVAALLQTPGGFQ